MWCLIYCIETRDSCGSWYERQCCLCSTATPVIMDNYWMLTMEWLHDNAHLNGSCHGIRDVRHLHPGKKWNFVCHPDGFSICYPYYMCIVFKKKTFPARVCPRASLSTFTCKLEWLKTWIIWVIVCYWYLSLFCFFRIHCKSYMDRSSQGKQHIGYEQSDV